MVRLGIFTVFAATFAPEFFPGDDPVASLLGALAIYAVGFFFRPLGGLVLAVGSTMAEQLPTEVRAAGLGLPYALSVEVFGGTAPFTIEWLNARDLSGVSLGTSPLCARSPSYRLSPCAKVATRTCATSPPAERTNRQRHQ
ncbi:hypothetical protein ABZS86_21270 [Streptomyces sp. NPDC005355]|uniref:hypothetical protein n=1 Tax=Streptomyces sp. NPDC005355 TaxID=3157038 RepID=UPI0033B41FB3